MYTKEIECGSCLSKSTIIEELLPESNVEQLEDAYCYDCKEKIYEGYISGWFFVERSTVDKKIEVECVFPMP